MKKLLYFLFGFSIILSSFANKNIALAENKETCAIVNPPIMSTEVKFIPGIKFNVSNNFNLNGASKYYIYIDSIGGTPHPRKIDAPVIIDQKNKQISIDQNFDKNGDTDEQSKHEESFSAGYVYFFITNIDHGEDIYAGVQWFTNLPGDSLQLGKERSLCKTDNNMIINVESTTISGIENCTISFSNPVFPGSPVKMTVNFPDTPRGKEFSGEIGTIGNANDPEGDDTYFDLRVDGPDGNELDLTTDNRKAERSTKELKKGIDLGSDWLGQRTYTAILERGGFGEVVGLDDKRHCANMFTPTTSGGFSGCLTDAQCTVPPARYCSPDAQGRIGCRENPGGVFTNPCNGVVNKDGTKDVTSCDTAIGPIETSPQDFIQNVLQLVLGLGGGILLVFLIINGYRLMFSQGDPEKIKEAKESIISAIAGLLLIILSLAILQLITVDLLGLPGFS